MRAFGVAATTAAIPLLFDGEASAAAQPPACLASVTLEPENAFVDQQVLYRLRISSRADVTAVEWIEPPAFPGFRAERLPGRPDAGRSVHAGAPYRVREEHRALFPERAGEVRVSPAILRCRVGDAFHPAPVPGATLRVRSLPEAGRPQGFSGLVGAVVVSRTVTPRTLALGESLHVGVVLQGAANVWDAADPGGDPPAAEAEIFRRRPSLHLARGVSLFARRRFEYELVPRRQGRLRIPALRIPYFDPAAGRYAEATAPPVAISVGPARVARGVEAAAAGTEPRGGPLASGSDRRGLAGWIAAAVGAAAVTVVARCAVRRRRRAGDAGAVRALAEARAATAGGDRDRQAAAYARALRAALAARVDGADALATEALAAEASLGPAVREAARLLAEVEHARFDPGATAPDPAEIERAVAALTSGERA